MQGGGGRFYIHYTEGKKDAKNEGLKSTGRKEKVGVESE